MKTMLLRMLAVAGMLALFAVSASGATVHVPGDYATIQGAVNAATPGDTIVVAAGTYVENVLVAKSVVLIGEPGAEVVPGSGIGFNMSTDDITIRGFTIHDAASGIQAYLVKSEYDVNFGYSNIKLLDNVIYDISDGVFGFGIYLGTESERYNPDDPIGIYDPSLTDLLDFTGLEIRGNEFFNTSGSAIVVQSMRSYDANPLLIAENFAHEGGEIWIDGSWDVTITGNRLDNQDTGVFLSNYGDGYYEGTPSNAFDPKNIVIRNNFFTGSTGYGGVVLYDGYPEEMTVEYNSFVGNTRGIYNYLATTLPSEKNWWGDASGPTHSGNPSGTGDPAVGAVSYDPWIGKSGGENIVCVADPESLTATSPTKTIDVDYLGGGSGPVYGYNMTFTWDPAVVSTSTAQVTEGGLLADQGSTWMEVRETGTGEITVHCVLLGAQPGVSGPGTLFSIEFDDVACGASLIDVTVNAVRDPSNQPLDGFYADDGEIHVDVDVPTFTVNGPAEGVCYSTAPVLDLEAADLCGGLDDGFYEINGGGPLALFADETGGTWSNSAWTLPGFGSLADDDYTLSFFCTDDFGNVSAVATWMFTKDTEAPPAATGFAAAPGHDKTHLSWTNPSSDLDHVLVVRKAWAASSPFGYPDYPQPAAGYPADPSDGDTVYAGTGTSFDDDPVADRSIYFYRVFSVDCAGNATGGTAETGPVPAAFAQGDRTTSYWLGDVTNSGGTGYDGEVGYEDITALSGTYWQTPDSLLWNGECDVGPTDDASRVGIPLPDALVDFEDLLIFAMNFHVVGPSGKALPEVILAGAAKASTPTLRLVPSETGTSSLPVVLRLDGNANVVKGASVEILFDASVVSFGGASASAELQTGPAFFVFDQPEAGRVLIDLAALGTDRVIGGSGALATLSFAVVGEGDANIRFGDVVLRNGMNEDVDFATDNATGVASAVVPTVTRLVGAAPNPFNPTTTIRFDLSEPSRVTVTIYDAQGRAVRTLVDGSRGAGSFDAVWDGRDDRGRSAGSGVYFVRMTAGDYAQSAKVVMLR